MKIVRFQTQFGSRWGLLEQGRVRELAGSPFEALSFTGEDFSLDEVRLLAPAEPSKIVCVGRNYADHAAERGAKVPDEPLLFLKAPTALIGPGERIVLPHPEHRVDYEAELAVIVGRQAKNLSEKEALDAVFGYTCANDISDRILQQKDGQFTRAKSFDTFCPLGPWAETGLDPSDLTVELSLNGELRQSASTRSLIFPVARLISFISEVMTLLPGDLILTGTPAGVGPLKPGDEVEVRVSGIGSLANTILKGNNGK